MEIVDYLLARKKAGGGSDVTIEQLSVTENGTYSEQGIAYSPVVVNVPAPENSYQLTDIPAATVSTIEDGTDLPMPSLKVGIEPVQDLHGYDHPWAGGAGKNLFPQQNVDGVTSVVISGLNITPGTYTLSAVVTSADTDDSLCLILNETTSSSLAYIGRSAGRTSTTFTTAVTITSIRIYASVNYVLSNGDAFSFKDIQLEEGSTATSYEPYSNICPIEGWTEANVTRTGKNLWNTDDITSISVGATAIRNGLYFRKPGQYTVSAQNSGNYLYCRVFNADGTIKETYNIVSMLTITNATFAISDGEYFAVYDAMESSINVSKERFNSWLCQVELGSTATTYEPYNGQTYTIQFKDGDNPLTVYGGTLDVTSGELVVDRVKKTYIGASNETWISISQGFYIEELMIESGTYKNGLSNWLKTAHNINDEISMSITFGTQYQVIKVNHIIDSISDITDAASWKTYLASNNLDVVYPLAEQLTYQLTPTQVRTLVGNNNIWADTGDIIEGKYYRSLT